MRPWLTPWRKPAPSTGPNSRGPSPAGSPRHFPVPPGPPFLMYGAGLRGRGLYIRKRRAPHLAGFLRGIGPGRGETLRGPPRNSVQPGRAYYPPPAQARFFALPRFNSPSPRPGEPPLREYNTQQNASLLDGPGPIGPARGGLFTNCVEEEFCRSSNPGSRIRARPGARTSARGAGSRPPDRGQAIGRYRYARSCMARPHKNRKYYRFLKCRAISATVAGLASQGYMTALIT